MGKFIKTLVIILLLAFPLSLRVNAESVININDLIENAKQLDGQQVIVQGEAIGERLDRGDYSWVNINDGTNAIGIWVKKSEAEKISFYGNYKHKGDIIKITGIFHRACTEHGGEADLHSSSMVIIEEGHAIKEQVSDSKIITTIILTFFALSGMFIFFQKRKLTSD